MCDLVYTAIFVKGKSGFKVHYYQDLINIFNACFAVTFNTRLVKGDKEPLYLPANASQPYHAIYFAHDYFSSALHECAHWFIAGNTRRLLEDYGYWYIPDGRNENQQESFEQVEVKPQALEWILSAAARYRFVFSFDNLSGEMIDGANFKRAVSQQVMKYCKQGLPPRAELFRQKLCTFYGTSVDINSNSMLQESICV